MATEHRCVSGGWKPGGTKECSICHPPRKESLIVIGDLPGRRASQGK